MEGDKEDKGYDRYKLLNGFQAPPFMDGEQQKCISRHVGQEILRPYFKPLHSWMGFHRLPPSPSKNCLLLTEMKRQTPLVTPLCSTFVTSALPVAPLVTPLCSTFVTSALPVAPLVPNNPSHLLAGVGFACFAGAWEAGTWGKTGETPLGAGLNPCPGKG
ncbi:hypothetical protein NIES4075_59380 [Tolypothrix sp. NIES-4075]|nr:hypothetical protein NIES4075_59380 [Tolypothrix sp. NIES-4075]